MASFKIHVIIIIYNIVYIYIHRHLYSLYSYVCYFLFTHSNNTQTLMVIHTNTCIDRRERERTFSANQNAPTTILRVAFSLTEAGECMVTLEEKEGNRLFLVFNHFSLSPLSSSFFKVSLLHLPLSIPLFDYI